MLLQVGPELFDVSAVQIVPHGVQVVLEIVAGVALILHPGEGALALTAATAFNADDILSLEAEGAEVQLVGNLRTVMYMILPGEEQHFTIKVGADSFEFAGLLFLAVPATLQQLDQVAELREAKEDVQDSLDAMDDSLDVILNSLDGMSGSLNTAAGGLEQLNQARGTIATRKDDLYAATDGLHDLDSARAAVSAGRDDLSQQIDAALASLTDLSAALSAMDRYNAVLSQSVDDAHAVLGELNAALQGLSPHLKTTRELVTKLRSDSQNLSKLLDDAEEHDQEAIDIISNLVWNLEYLEDSVEDLHADLDRLERALRLTSGLKPLSTDDLLGMLSAEEQAQMKEVLNLHAQYETYLKDNGLTISQLSFQDFIVAGAYRQFCEATVKAQVEALVPAEVEKAAGQFAQANGRAPSEEELAAIQTQTVAAVTEAVKAQLPTLEQFARDPAAQEYVEKAAAAQAAYDQFAAKGPIVDALNGKIKEVNALVTGLTAPTGQVVGDLADLCREATDSGLMGDLVTAAELGQDLLETLKAHEGQGQALLGHLDEVGELLSALTTVGDDLLAQADKMDNLVDTYTPDLQSAITDVEALSKSLQNTLNATSGALGTAKGILDAAGDDLDRGAERTLKGLTSASDAMRAADGDLDCGTQAALAGAAAALRKSTAGLDKTGTIRDAKDTIRDLVEEKWDEHSGQVDGLLNIDAGAIPVSMTDSRNAAPESIQYVMRTQEIKVEEPEEETPQQQGATQTTFWDRVAALFKGLWEDLMKLLHIGG